jgi:Membrane protein putatively involved in post-translational modification of the autoinducing quorum-sensing peptide
MIDALADKIAVKLKEANPEETASVEVMKFALIGLLHNALIFVTALTVGLVLGQFLDTLIAAICFMLLRLVSGGFHFKTPLSCLLFSSFVFVAIPLVPIDDTWIMVVNGLTLLLVLIFAPSNIREHIRVSEKYFPVFKVISAVLVAASFLIGHPIVTLAFFVQSLTLIAFERR